MNTPGRRRAALLLAAAGALAAAPSWCIAAEPPQVEADIAYIAGATAAEHKLDVYHGEIQAGRPRPVLVYVHGGGWGRGDKRLGKSMAPLYVENNCVFVSLNYRLAPKNKYPAFMQDLAAAMRWIKDNIGRYGGDPDHIVLAGHSAGAHLVALLGTDPQFLQAQKLPSNMFRAVVPVDTASFNFLVDPYGWFVGRQKKIREEAFGTDREVFTAASPTLVVAKAKPGSVSPFAIFVGSKRTDAVEQSEAFAQALRKAGAEAQVFPLDLGHARINQAIGDRNSPLAKTILGHLTTR
ncbi:MAG: alpha/beta hydrolase [Rubrivivax sp.]